MIKFSLALLTLALSVSACSSEQGPSRVVRASSVKAGGSDSTKGGGKGTKTEETTIGGEKPDDEEKPSDKPTDESTKTPSKPDTEEPSKPDPVQPKPDPVQPKPDPVQPKPDPVTPKPETPMQSSDCHKGDDFICAAEKACLEQTNKYRASSGKSALKHDPKVAWVSRDWSKQQANRNSISHDGFPAQRKQVYKGEFNTTVDFWAENVAMFGGANSDPVAVAKKFTDMWWNSAGHKANMLGNHKNLGCGIYKKGTSFYGTQLFN